MKKNNESLIDCLEWVFKIGFVLYSLLSFNSLCYGKGIISMILWPTVLIGAIVLLIRLIRWKRYITMPGILFLGLFIVSYVISALVNIRYGYKEGVIKLIFLLFYFFIFFTKKSAYSIYDLKKEINIFGWILQVYMFICVLISFGFMIFNYAKVETVENGWDIGIGFLWGRLWGVFTEPNYASVFAAITIVLSYYFFRRVGFRSLRFCLVINAILQIFYIAFTDSRTGRVTLAIVLVFFTFNRLNYLRIHNLTAKRIRLYVIIPCLAAAFLVGMYGPKVITVSYNQIRARYGNGTNEISRGYDLSGDPSNRRFDIWMSGIEVFSTTPLFGTSYTNILQYTLDNCEDTYLIDNSAEKNFSSIHNEVLNVLVGQGIFGVAILLLFVVYVILKYVKYYFRMDEDMEIVGNTTITSCIAAVSGAMFLTGMFYSNSPAAILFWIFLGGLLKLLRQADKNQELITEETRCPKL